MGTLVEKLKEAWSALSTLGGGAFLIAAMFGAAIFAVVARSIVLLVAAKIAGVEKASLLRAIWALFLSLVLGGVGGVLGELTGLQCAAFFLAPIGTLLGLKIAFSTTLNKSIVVWIIDFIAMFVLLALLLGALLLLVPLLGGELPAPPPGP